MLEVVLHASSLQPTIVLPSTVILYMLHAIVGLELANKAKRRSVLKYCITFKTEDHPINCTAKNFNFT